jgi:hypothetical protein
MVERHNARLARLDHAHFDPGPKPHLVEAANQMRVSIDLENATSFSGLKEMQRHNVRHKAWSWQGEIEIESQLVPF